MADLTREEMQVAELLKDILDSNNDEDFFCYLQMVSRVWNELDDVKKMGIELSLASRLLSGTFYTMKYTFSEDELEHRQTEGEE